MVMKFTKPIIIVFALFGADQMANANSPESEPSWQGYNYYVEFSGSAVKKKARDRKFVTETIYTDLNEQPGNVAFTCINELLTVSVAYKPLDLKDFIKNHRTSRRWKTRMAEVTIDGELQKMNSWTYLPKYGVAISRKRSDGAKLYNAAIRGQSVIFDFDFKKPVELILPKPNMDFAEFGGPCGMGKYKDSPQKIRIDTSNLSEDPDKEIDLSDPN